MLITEPTLIAEWEKVGVWTSLGAPRRASYRRGKERALDKVAPGTLRLTMSNGDRSLDPDHNAAVALLQPGVRVRLRATYNAITYTLFTGYLERQWDEGNGPHDAVTMLQVVDGLAVLAAAGLESPWVTAMRNLTPRSWFRMGERLGPYLYDKMGRSIALIVGPVALGQPSLLAADGDASVTFPNTANAYVVVYPEALPTTLSWTVSVVMRLPASFPAAEQLLIYDARYPQGFQLSVRTDGTLLVGHRSGPFLSVATSAVHFCDDVAHTINFRFIDGQTPKIFIGDQDYTAAGAYGSVHTPVSGGYWVVGISAYLAVKMDELRIFDFALTAAQMLALDNAALGWPNDSVATRVRRVLDGANWPVGLRSITTEQDDNLQPITATNLVALPHLQEIETTIEGRLWVAPDGTLKLLGRNEFLVTHNESLGTYADDGIGLGYTKVGAYVRDWSLVTNVVRRVNGADITTATDAASIVRYGLRDQSDAAESASLYATLKAEGDLASFRLAHFKDPVPYIEGLEVQPRTDPANLWPQVLGRDLGDRITFKNKPQKVGAMRIIETIIEGMSVDIGPKSWVVNYSIDAVAAQRYFQFNYTLWDSPDWRFSA